MTVKAPIINDLFTGKTRWTYVINPQRAGTVPLDLLLRGKVEAVPWDCADLITG